MMDSYSLPPLSPGSLVAGAWRHRSLIRQLVWREIVGRYRGSIAGLSWSLLHPLLMLAVYTFVFSTVFGARWTGLGNGEGHTHFAVVLFVGVIVHGMFSEAITKAPALILVNANLVKKVVFPLEILAWSLVGSALFHAAVSLMILLLAIWVLEGGVPLTAFWLPVIFLPVVLFSLGIVWCLASLGVFLRDITQVAGLVSMAMMFLAPVFYPLNALPETYRHWLFVNPVTLPVEQMRVVLFAGAAPDTRGLLLYYAVAIVVALLGYACFQKTRRGFADVL